MDLDGLADQRLWAKGLLPNLERRCTLEFGARGEAAALGCHCLAPCPTALLQVVTGLCVTDCCLALGLTSSICKLH